MVLGLSDGAGRLGANGRRFASAAVVVASLTTAGIGVAAVERTHDLSARLVSNVTDLAATTEPGDGGKPVILTTQPELARSAWSTFHEHRWLSVPAGAVSDQLQVLDEAGVDELVLATLEADGVIRQLTTSPYDPGFVAPSGSSGRWWVTELER